MNLKPLATNLVVKSVKLDIEKKAKKELKKEAKKKDSPELAQPAETRTNAATVLEIGPDVRGISKGDIVVINDYSPATQILIEGEKLYVVSDKAVLAIIKGTDYRVVHNEV